MRLGTGEFFGRTDRQLELEGIRFSVRLYDPLDDQPWHTHEHPTFFAHFAGEQLDDWGKSEWYMSLLSLTYHPSSSLHKSRVGPGGAKGINLEVSEDWLEARQIDTADLGDHRGLECNEARLACLRLIRMFAPESIHGGELSDIALELIEPFVNRPFPHEALTPTWLRQAEEAIQQRFREPIGLASVADEVAVHPVHLARTYRQRHGCSVTDHLQRLRLQAAVSQILAGDSIGSAALDAGFSDQFYFSRVLKAHYGYSPKLVKQLASHPRLKCC